MNVACDYEAPMQMLTTEKYIASWGYHQHNVNLIKVWVQYIRLQNYINKI